MLRGIFTYLFNKNGWVVKGKLPDHIKSCVLLAGPHTSNWDTVYAIAGLNKLGVNVRFALKKELMVFPFKPFLRGIGAIPIDRSPNKSKKRISAVDAMASLFDKHDDLVLMISPEGTRAPKTKWKTGFYYVAKNAGVPIVCAYLDYKKKIAGIGPHFTTDLELPVLMKKIQDFYSTITPKFPEKFKTANDE